MSGIAGFHRKDDAAVDRGDLERMAARLAHRGPDAEGIWAFESAGMIHRAMWTTPGARTEKCPTVLREGGAVITADARIDDRDALLDELGLGRDEPGLGDATLILHAYQRWGRDCPRRLIGDFAFAIWDPVRRELFCARDAFGVKPFYYFDSARLFAFGSEIKALLSLPDVPRRIDEMNIGFFLEEASLEQEGTLFQGIRRLPPGCGLTLRGGRLTVARYYSVLEVAPLPSASDQDYIEEYAHRFEIAVRDRLVGDRRVGSMLSGGLDSSTIVCSAREQLHAAGHEPLPTFSIVFDEVAESDESSYIEAVLAGGLVEPHFLRGDQLAPFAEWENVLRCLDEPSYGANLFLNRAVYRAAQQENVGVMLDGFDGDAVVGYGFERLAELARRGQLPSLLREVFATARVLDLSPGRVFSAYVRRPLVQGWRRRAPTPLKTLWRRVRRGSRGGDGAAPLCPLTRTDFARRVGLQARIRDLEDGHRRFLRESGVTDDHGLTAGRQTTILEILDKVSAAQGVECRYPFFDRRLVEYALGLPARMRLQGGLTRFVQRFCAPGLPDEVRWRSWKGDLSHNFLRALRRFDMNRLESFISDPGSPVYDFVDRVELSACLEGFRTKGDAKCAFELSKAASLNAWLELLGAKV